MHNLFGALFVIFVTMAILASCSEIVMRVRLSRREPSRDKLLWWRRGGDEVSMVYQETFPASRLPIFRRIVFWSLLAFCSLVLLSTLAKRN